MLKLKMIDPIHIKLNLSAPDFKSNNLHNFHFRPSDS